MCAALATSVRNRKGAERSEGSSSVTWIRNANRHNAEHYRAEAAKCHDLAERANDFASRLYWEQAERCWLTMAHHAEVAQNLLSGRKRCARLKNGEWE